ncbi:hypothetical protein [Nitrosococcus wardiae]|uniref:hypothetical protein n=1 Tax=Nitrosococcus wardiae TaxID=1814290 RepID=UPI00197F915A|nr:hypothetical protein [Nitrosococcus wardiae]
MGAVAIVLGVLLAAIHGNEWMKQGVIVQATPASGVVPAAECPEDELEEERLSLAECKQMVANVQNFILSAPDWFFSFQMALACVGTIIAFVSIILGVALVHYRRWAPTAAVLVFAALAIIDVVDFIAVVNTGPILRSMYLWDILLWFFIHLVMTVGAIVGRQSQIQSSRQSYR